METLSGTPDTGDDPPINIREFMETWSRKAPDQCSLGADPQPPWEEYIAGKMSIDLGVLRELDGVCGPDTLTCPQENCDRELMLTDDLQGLETELASVQYQREDLKRRQDDLKYKHQIFKSFKYRIRTTPWKHSQLVTSHPGTLTEPQVLVTVEMYRPFLKGRQVVLESEIQLLGTSYLTDIKDQLVCLTDQMAPGECSRQPNVKPDLKAKDMYKSSFLFVEGTFYNDFRDVNNIDNSQVIIDWAKKEGITTYDKRKMEETRVLDLKVRVGYPYVLQHQGNCEHVIVFSDIQMLHPEDCCDPTAYPIVTFQRGNKRIQCRCCTMYLSKWVTIGSTMCPEDPCFFCSTCFQAFHYDVHGNKLFDFRAYRYPELEAP